MADQERQGPIATTETETPPLKGRPVSGKVWKGERQRMSRVKKECKALRPGFEARRAKEEDCKTVRAQERELKGKRKSEKEAKRKRQEENAKRRAANEKKNATVQVISDPRKLRKLTRKQIIRNRIVLMTDTSSLEKH